MNPNYERWLGQHELQRRTVQTYKSDATRVEREYGDLDELYDEDNLVGVLQDLEYSRDDENRNRPNPSKIAIDAEDGSPYGALASYRTAIRRYCEFRQAITEVWDHFLEEARRRFEDGTLDRAEGYKEEHLGPAVCEARRAFLTNEEGWPELLKAAIRHNKNNVINRRSYAAGNESNQAKVVGWIDADPTGVRDALLELWSEDDRLPGDRIRAFNAKLPTDVLGEGQRSARLDVASYLLMGLDVFLYPPCRMSKFRSVRELLHYPEPKAEDLGSEYENALQLLDDLLDEAAKRDIDRPSSRLDAQSVVWSLSDLAPQPAVTKRVGDSLSPSHTTRPTASEEPLNTILYGPPGTGKTYATVMRCVTICDGQAPQNADLLRARHGELMDEGRIEFVTFHQSYGYEEFVEGIRPIGTEVDASLRLAVVPGVLKRIAERARKIPDVGARHIFKMSLGDPKSWGGSPDSDGIFDECIDAECALLEYGGDIDWSDPEYDDWSLIWKRWRTDVNPDATAYDTNVQAMWRFRTEMRHGDIVVASDGYRHFRAVGEVSGDYEFHQRPDGFCHRRPVRWHWRVREREGDPVSIFKTGSFQWRPINRMKPSNPAGLAAYLQGVDGIGEARPHVLVIDEINRANISKVMGELITLLEEDKREGAENEVTVTLPYSREQFTLPKNLHILGTMNTADRSIALLDTALRRRFRFEEMPPQPELKALRVTAERTGVDLPRLISVMNRRLEYLVDRDHLIGHAWFMGANDRTDIDDIMRHKIIPLIAEYFYDDWRKVHAVLGGTDDFVKGEPLNPPPGLDATVGEDRHRWTVQNTFAKDAYERLIGGHPSAGGE
ncbi:MAG: AAA family ATPase [Gammaproteobacteria bacterium]|nr:AAA family ATPase [Gammaproteobacteria bacterium]